MVVLPKYHMGRLMESVLIATASLVDGNGLKVLFRPSYEDVEKAIFACLSEIIGEKLYSDGEPLSLARDEVDLTQFLSNSPKNGEIDG